MNLTTARILCYIFAHLILEAVTMSNPLSSYQAVVCQYYQLPLYKKIGFWLSAPRLSWGLFGYQQNPNQSRIKQLTQWAKASWFFKTKFEKLIYTIVEPELNLSSNYNRSSANTNFTTIRGGLSQTTALGECADVINHIAEYGEGSTYAATSRFHRDADQSRKLKITNQLLLAVAYGMESKEVNEPVHVEDAGKLFKQHLHAKELLQQSPEYLLERGKVTDWAGRAFNDITAFEYALWVKDFKMIEMMLGCIPATSEGDAIRTALLEQAQRVTAPISAGGGLTYRHTNKFTNLDASGKPDGKKTFNTTVRTENHFDITPLCAAYQDYDLTNPLIQITEKIS